MAQFDLVYERNTLLRLSRIENIFLFVVGRLTQIPIRADQGCELFLLCLVELLVAVIFAIDLSDLFEVVVVLVARDDEVAQIAHRDVARRTASLLHALIRVTLHLLNCEAK